jgi:TPR repeat protein
MFLRGQGIENDLIKAVYWHEHAAKLGYVEAQRELGRLKQDAHHPVLRDPEGAIYWSKTAAENGSVPAIAQIGYCFQHGIGVEQDLTQAAAHYSDAANKGNWAASFSLGTLYEHGEGVPQDYAAARKCYEFAAEHDEPSAFFNLGRFFQFGLSVAPDFAQALKLYLKAAEFGHAQCQLLVGQALLLGQEGTPVDEAAGFAWMLRAAEKGMVEAQDEVGFRFMTGRGVATNAEQAQYWNRQAAKRGHPRAQCMLAYSIIGDEHAHRDNLVEAAKWLILAFNQPDNLDDQLSAFINQEWQNVCSRLSDEDLNEAQQQADAELAGE